MNASSRIGVDRIAVVLSPIRKPLHTRSFSFGIALVHKRSARLSVTVAGVRTCYVCYGVTVLTIGYALLRHSLRLAVRCAERLCLSVAVPKKSFETSASAFRTLRRSLRDLLKVFRKGKAFPHIGGRSP